MRLQLVNASMDVARDIALTDSVFDTMLKELRAVPPRNPPCLLRFECDRAAGEFLDIVAIRDPKVTVSPGERTIGREFHGVPIVLVEGLANE